MPHVEQEVPAFDEVDVAVVFISPARWPGVNEGEVISAIGEAPFPADHRHMADCEMVIATETLAKMFIGDATVLASFLMVLFSGIPVFLSMLFLG